jgi:hypothetical protein
MLAEKTEVDISLRARDRLVVLRDEIAFVADALGTGLDFLTIQGHEGMISVLKGIADELDGMSDGYVLDDVPETDKKTERED